MRFGCFYLTVFNEQVIYHCGNIACELGEVVAFPQFFVKARECFITTFRDTFNKQTYIKQVTEKALALMEKAEKVCYLCCSCVAVLSKQSLRIYSNSFLQHLSGVHFEGALEVFKAVLSANPEDHFILFLCAEICFSWAKTLDVCAPADFLLLQIYNCIFFNRCIGF